MKAERRNRAAAPCPVGCDDTLSTAPGLRCFFLPLLLSLQGFHELIRFLLGNLPGGAVVFLDLADENMAPSVDYVQVIVGQLAPLFLDLAFVLLPFAFHLVPVHGLPPW